MDTPIPWVAALDGARVLAVQQRRTDWGIGERYGTGLR